MLVLAGTVAVLARSGAFSTGGLRLGGDDVPACTAPVNRWADQRLQRFHEQLKTEHSIYRSAGEAPNAIGAALTWFDDRIIERRLGDERQRIRSTLLQSMRCQVQFQP